MATATVRRHLWIRGRVQGVFFRESLRQQAEAARVAGWTRNRSDGRVEAVLEGDPDAVQRVVTWCHRGPPAAQVAAVEQLEEPAVGEKPPFRVLR